MLHVLHILLRINLYVRLSLRVSLNAFVYGHGVFPCQYMCLEIMAFISEEEVSWHILMSWYIPTYPSRRMTTQSVDICSFFLLLFFLIFSFLHHKIISYCYGYHSNNYFDFCLCFAIIIIIFMYLLVHHQCLVAIYGDWTIAILESLVLFSASLQTSNLPNPTKSLFFLKF